MGGGSGAGGRWGFRAVWVCADAHVARCGGEHKYAHPLESEGWSREGPPSGPWGTHVPRAEGVDSICPAHAADVRGAMLGGRVGPSVRRPRAYKRTGWSSQRQISDRFACTTTQVAVKRTGRPAAVPSAPTAPRTGPGGGAVLRPARAARRSGVKRGSGAVARLTFRAGLVQAHALPGAEPSRRAVQRIGSSGYMGSGIHPRPVHG